MKESTRRLLSTRQETNDAPHHGGVYVDGVEETNFESPDGIYPERDFKEVRKQRDAESVVLNRQYELARLNFEGKSYSATESDMVELFAYIFRATLAYVPEMNQYYIFDDTRWRPEEFGEVMHLIKEFPGIIRCMAQNDYMDEKLKVPFYKLAKHYQSLKMNKAFYDSVKYERRLVTTAESFNLDNYQLNFVNGTLNLKTKEFCRHDANNYITKIVHTDYNSEATCPKFQKFLDEIMAGDEERIRFLQRCLGYSITGDTREQVLFVCYGPGANGKTVLLETFMNILGANYTANIPSASILENHYNNSINSDIAALKDIRFVKVNEISQYRYLDESKVKELSGCDKITARFLYQDYFTYTPKFKLWLVTNHKPKIRGTDEGIWRRLVFIPFTVVIPSEQQDTCLMQKLLDEEQEGIIAWIVNGCYEWMRIGLAIPQSFEDQKADYRIDRDVFKSFLEETIVSENNSSIAANVLYESYKNWAEKKGEQAMSITAFGNEMSERNYQKKRKSDGFYYLNIRLK